MVLYEGMRQDVIVSLEQLADIEHQKAQWIERKNPQLWYSFDEVVHTLFDDSGFVEDLQSTIGYLLRNQAEANAIAKVMTEIDMILDKLGNDKTDEEYINDPEWASVVASAQKALILFRKEDAE